MQLIILLAAFLIMSVSSGTFMHKLHKENFEAMMAIYKRMGLRDERLLREEKRLQKLDLVDLLFERYQLEQQIKY